MSCGAAPRAKPRASLRALGCAVKIVGSCGAASEVACKNLSIQPNFRAINTTTGFPVFLLDSCDTILALHESGLSHRLRNEGSTDHERLAPAFTSVSRRHGKWSSRHSAGDKWNRRPRSRIGPDQTSDLDCRVHEQIQIDFVGLGPPSNGWQIQMAGEIWCIQREPIPG